MEAVTDNLSELLAPIVRVVAFLANVCLPGLRPNLPGPCALRRTGSIRKLLPGARGQGADAGAAAEAAEGLYASRSSAC